MVVTTTMVIVLLTLFGFGSTTITALEKLKIPVRNKQSISHIVCVFVCLFVCRIVDRPPPRLDFAFLHRFHRLILWV